MEGLLRHTIKPPLASEGRGIGLSPVAGFNRRYVWRQVNFSRFLYDRLEDLHIPEQIYRSFIQD